MRKDSRSLRERYLEATSDPKHPEERRKWETEFKGKDLSIINSTDQPLGGARDLLRFLIESETRIPEQKD